MVRMFARACVFVLVCLPVGLIMALTWWEECHDRPCGKAIIEALLQFNACPEPKVACIGVDSLEYQY